MTDHVAWTANGGDGILALDVDHSGKIESGNELFTPNFNGGHFADGIAALASLDGNHDGKIDSQDQAFGELVVWQDANHNGISETGELAKLSDLGIKSIDLATTPGALRSTGRILPATVRSPTPMAPTGASSRSIWMRRSAPRRRSTTPTRMRYPRPRRRVSSPNSTADTATST